MYFFLRVMFILFRPFLNKVNSMHPLNFSREGEEVVVKQLDCQCDEMNRITELGCVEGACGTIISNQKNVIFKVGETRLAIDGRIANCILVSPL